MRVTKLLPPRTAEEALARQGFDGPRLQRLANAVAHSWLNRRGAYLGDRFEDLVSYLVEVGLRTALRYDPARVRPGYSFDSYLWDILERRCVDFLRRKAEGYADGRYSRNQQPLILAADPSEFLDEPYVLPEDDLEDVRTSAAELADERGLSEAGRWALLELAAPMAEGATATAAALEAGLTVVAAARRLEELREELAHVVGPGEIR